MICLLVISKCQVQLYIYLAVALSSEPPVCPTVKKIREPRAAMSAINPKKTLRLHFSSTPPENGVILGVLDLLRRVRKIEHELVDASDVGNAPGSSLSFSLLPSDLSC